MATPKQLAALKKARAARAKNISSGSKAPKKKAAPKRKVAAKKPVAKKAAIPVKKIFRYTIEVTRKDRKKGFLTDNGGFDTSITKAALFDHAEANKMAHKVFKEFNAALNQVNVIARKVSIKTPYNVK